MIDKDARIVARGGNIVIGDDVFIGKNATLIAFADLTIGPRTLIGENCSLHTENHGPPSHRDDYVVGSITIGSDVWLGAGVVVALGTSIGDRITVGANSVVTRDLTREGTYAGAPAREIGAHREP